MIQFRLAGCLILGCLAVIALPRLARADDTPQRPTTRPGQFGQRLKAALEKLDLTPDQKEKIKRLMAEEKKKIEEIRSEAQGGDKQKVREQAIAAMKEIREKLMEILTPEQQQKLKELIGNSTANQGARRRPGAANNNASEKPDSPNSN